KDERRSGRESPVYVAGAPNVVEPEPAVRAESRLGRHADATGRADDGRTERFVRARRTFGAHRTHVPRPSLALTVHDERPFLCGWTAQEVRSCPARAHRLRAAASPAPVATDGPARWRSRGRSLRPPQGFPLTTDT